MEEVCLHKSNIQIIHKKLIDLVESNKRYRLIVKEWKDKRSINQNDLSHMWYTEIANQVNQKLRKNVVDLNSVKFELKERFLGYEEVEHTSLFSGNKTVKMELVKTSELDKGSMHFYLQQIETWAYQNGLRLTIPNNSEYRKIQTEQVKS